MFDMDNCAELNHIKSFYTNYNLISLISMKSVGVAVILDCAQ